MQRILCTIILFFNTVPLFGAEKPSEKSIFYQKDRIDSLKSAHRGLEEGFNLHIQGKPQEALPLLLGGYYRVKKHDPSFASIESHTYGLICDAISKIQLDRTSLFNPDINEAINFAHKAKPTHPSAITEVAKILMQKGHKTEAFSLFEQERHTNLAAKKYYDNSLCYGIGCEYDPVKNLPYFLQQIKSINNDHFGTEKTQTDRDDTIGYISYFADNGDMRSQCIVIKMYMNGDYSIPVSHEQALHYCVQFMLKFMALPSLEQLPLEYFIIPLTLKQLSFTNQKASLLNTVYNALYAKKSNNSKKIIDICSKLPKKSLTPTLIKLLCTDGNDSLINLDKIKAIMLSNKKFKQFCDFDDGVMVFFLEQKLAMLSEQQNNLTDALHYIIGLFAYRNQQYRKAHSHFAQCISYDKDLYTQALLLETSSTEDSLAIATSIMPLLTNAAQCSKPRSRDEVAKKIIAHIFNSVHQHYVSQLLFRAKYTQAYQFASYLTELPDTHQAACNAFIKIENRIMKESEENYKKLVTIPYRIHTLTAFKKLAAQKNHPLCICDCLAFFLQEQIVCKWTDESIKNSLEEECLSHLYCGLQHKDISDHYKKSLLHVCGLLACHLGTTNKSLDLLDQAISFGNVTALYEKAMMLLTSPSVTNNIPEILDLFKKNAESNDPRSIKSIKQLAEYYHGKTGLDDKKQSFCYLTAAAEMNDYEMAPLLAYFYAHGIREKNGEWYLLPDSTKALHYLTQNIEQGNNRFLAQALNMRAMMYHKNNEFEKACDDLKEYISYELTHNQKAVSFWLMGLMQLHNNENNEPTTEIVNYFRAANKELENSFLSKTKLPDFLSYTNEESRKIIKEKVNSILSTNDTKLDSLDFCYLMSKFLFESTYRQPITNKDRIFAIAGLRYAAENNCFEAQLLLLQTDEKEVCLYDKIYYLETSLQKNPSLTIAIQPILDNLHPKTIELQAGLVNFYVEKGNEALATKYLSCMYENNSPVLNDPIYYRTFSYEQAIELINACAKNEFLVKFANNFVKNPRKSIPAEHFAAILWGSLLSYSIDEKQLMAAANYLQKACDNFPIIQMKYITNNLGQIYYKLGWRYTQKNSYKPLLAIAYLQKGAKLENSNSWKLLVKLWLEKVPEARSIDKKTILEYAYNANLREESSHSKELFQKCSAELCSENTNLPLIASIDFATSVMVDTNEQIMEKILEQKKQPSYSLLINAVSSREAIDQEFNKAVNLSDNIAENRMAIIDLYEKLAHRNNPHPHACMKLASLYFSQPSIKCDIIKRYLHDAIVHGLVHPAGKPNALFKDTVITNILFEFIHDVAYDQNRKYQGMILLKEIKKYLLEQKVNIAAFESLFKFTCSKDLTKHATWKQKK